MRIVAAGDPRQRAFVGGRWRGDPMTDVHAHGPLRDRSLLVPVLWGLVVGAVQAGSPIVVRWLDSATVYALELAVIAAVYVGFAVADGRPRVIAVECVVAGVFVVLAMTAVTGTAWLLVLGYAGHGLKDAWQERRRYVANTRWWPPFCAAVDWLLAVILVVVISAGVHLH
jgi:hypothetical protein